MSWVKQIIILLSIIPLISSIVDCAHGFVGRMQASLTDDFIYINDTRMCAADRCIKVLLHSAFDDDDTFQQGVSSRCAYTGGDRQMCQLANPCTPVSFYDGMKGNFSFCCCRENGCNIPQVSELDAIYGSAKKRSRSSYSTYTVPSALSAVVLILFSTCGVL